MSCEFWDSSLALSGVKWPSVEALRYEIIASPLSDQKLVSSLHAVVIRVITHS